MGSPALIRTHELAPSSSSIGSEFCATQYYFLDLRAGIGVGKVLTSGLGYGSVRLRLQAGRRVGVIDLLQGAVKTESETDSVHPENVPDLLVSGLS